MSTHSLNMWKAKLKAAKLEEQQWAKAYNRAERAMLRIGKDIDELEKKIESELARIESKTAAADRAASAGHVDAGA